MVGLFGDLQLPVELRKSQLRLLTPSVVAKVLDFTSGMPHQYFGPDSLPGFVFYLLVPPDRFAKALNINLISFE